MRHTIRSVAVIVSLTLFLSLGGISSVQAQPSVNSSVVVRTWNQLALNTARVKVLSDAQAVAAICNGQCCNLRCGQRYRLETRFAGP